MGELDPVQPVGRRMVDVAFGVLEESIEYGGEIQDEQHRDQKEAADPFFTHL